MKLNEYIYEKLMNAEEILRRCRAASTLSVAVPITEEDIEDWIVEWYGKTFQQPTAGCGNLGGKPAFPPLWLADWRPRIRPLHEQGACGVDEC